MKIVESFVGLPPGTLPGDSEGYTSALHRKLKMMWAESDLLFAQGRYHRSVALRRDTLTLLWASIGLNVDTHWPIGISPFYSHAIGHFFNAAMISQAQEVDLISSEKRVFPSGHVANQETLEALGHLFCVNERGDSAVGQTLQKIPTPLAWAYFERLEIVKTNIGFLDQYALWEEIQSRGGQHAPLESPFKLSGEYAEDCLSSLKSVGFDVDRPFVALHLREHLYDPNDHRLAPLEAHLESIRFLQRIGYQVVRIGSPWMSDFPAMKGVLDLVSLLRGQQSTHLWVLKNADFLISTTSGPAYLAASLGTRFLMTNATSIGRNTITGPPGTRYLPKHIFQSHNQEMSLSAILTSPVGYWEGVRTESTESVQVVPNSSREILKATMEMISYSNGFPDGSEFDFTVGEIRAREGAVSKGTFSSTFLADNPRWLE